MLRSLTVAAVAAFLMATPALASHCPKDAAAIDAALAKMSLPDDVRAEIVELRDSGMAAHEAGNHSEAEATLADAMRRLLMAVE